MKTSEQVDKLFPALVAAQAASKAAKKDAQNPHFRSHYADLASVWEAVSDALAKNKLAVIQAPGFVSEGQLLITTRIVHDSGQWLESEASTPLQKLDPQGYGSAVTYMRRYTLAALLGVVAEDDDGNAASGARPVERAPVVVGSARSTSQHPEAAQGVRNFPAKFAGRCHDCGGRVEMGDSVHFVPGKDKKVAHESCPSVGAEDMPEPPPLPL